MSWFERIWKFFLVKNRKSIYRDNFDFEKLEFRSPKRTQVKVEDFQIDQSREVARDLEIQFRKII